MKTRSTLVLLVLACALFLFIRFYTDKKPGTREAFEASQYAVSFDRDQVDRITISRGDEIRVVLAKTGDGWHLEEPIKDRADSMQISQMFTEIERIRHDRVIPPQSSKEKNRDAWRDFGLVHPKMRIEFGGENAPPDILIGRETAVDHRIYLAVEGSDTAYVVSLAVRDAVNKQPDEFRDRQLTKLPATQIERVLLNTPDGEIELRKDETEWDLLRPVRARADTQRLADLVRGGVSARVIEFVGDDRGDLAAYGLAEPRGTVSFFAADESESAVFQIGARREPSAAAEDSEPDGVYVRYAARNTVALMPLEMENFLTTTPDTLRDRRLVRLNLDVVDRVTLTPADASPVVLVRDQEEWKIQGDPARTANASQILKLLGDLKNTEATGFVADTPADLARYGLDIPRLKITISSYASENVPEGGAGEHPILNLAFGNAEADVVHARLVEEPFIVSVEPSLVEEIPIDPIAWRSLPVFAFFPEALSTITREKEGETLTLQRGDDGAWKIEGESEIDAVHASSLTNTLARLRAVRWLGGAAPEHGLDTPEITLTFVADGETHVLRIGAEHESMHCATTGDGVFLINRPDYNALTLPLTRQVD